jgi:hypothetical protein
MEDFVSLHPNDSASKTASKSLSRQTSLYAIAAAAAGVSVLALAKPADAEVVVTKANIPVTSFSGVSLDLNKDGIADFKLFVSFYSAGSFFSDKLMVTPLAGGADIGGSFVYASALVRGAKIGPSAHFGSFPEIESSHANVNFNHSTRRFFGKWGVHQRNRYLGVKFLIDGKTHYGWIRLTVSTSGPRSLVGTITGYAYETVPSQAILAGSAEKATAEFQVSGDIRNQGKPSLGMLALGAEGFLLWRREET